MNGAGVSSSAYIRAIAPRRVAQALVGEVGAEGDAAGRARRARPRAGRCPAGCSSVSRCSGRTARSVGGLTPRSRPGGAIPYRRGKPAARRVAPARVPGLLGGIRDPARPGPAAPSLTHSVDAAVARRQRARCPGRGSRVLQRHAEVRVAALEPSGDGSTPSIRADVRPFSALLLKRGGSAAQLVQRGLDAAREAPERPGRHRDRRRRGRSRRPRRRGCNRSRRARCRRRAATRIGQPHETWPEAVAARVRKLSGPACTSARSRPEAGCRMGARAVSTSWTWIVRRRSSGAR